VTSCRTRPHLIGRVFPWQYVGLQKVEAYGEGAWLTRQILGEARFTIYDTQAKLPDDRGAIVGRLTEGEYITAREYRASAIRERGLGRDLVIERHQEWLGCLCCVGIVLFFWIMVFYGIYTYRVSPQFMWPPYGPGTGFTASQWAGKVLNVAGQTTLIVGILPLIFAVYWYLMQTSRILRANAQQLIIERILRPSRVLKADEIESVTAGPRNIVWVVTKRGSRHKARVTQLISYEALIDMGYLDESERGLTELRGLWVR